MRVAITGSNGYVGRAIKDYFIQRGHEVLELRRPKEGQGEVGSVLPYRLGDSPQDPRLQGCDALIHCAYDFSSLQWEEIHRSNVIGTEKLFEAARSQGIKKIILISSVSAFEGCASFYGRAKLETEAVAKKFGAISVRPGLVYGDAPGGMVGTLDKLISKLPLVPEIGGGQEMYLVHQDDLSLMIHNLLTKETGPVTHPLMACHADSMKFRGILRSLAARRGVRRTFLPVPWRCAWFGLKSLELCGIRLGIKSDSLISMMNPNPKPVFAMPEGLDVTFRSFR